MLTVTVGLFVPFDISVFAVEQAATGDDIYAILYQYTSSDKYELVFQNGDDVDPNKTFVKKYSGFADTVKSQGDSWIA